MEISPYLLFNGTCAEAFTFYHRVLGGTLEPIMKAGDMPPAPGAPHMAPDTVIHACLRLGNYLLMGSDDPVSYAKPAGTSVSIAVDDIEEGRRIFEALSEGGSIGMPFGETFWSPGFGMCVDRFGTPWMVNTKPLNEEPAP